MGLVGYGGSVSSSWVLMVACLGKDSEGWSKIGL